MSFNSGFLLPMLMVGVVTIATLSCTTRTKTVDPAAEAAAATSPATSAPIDGPPTPPVARVEPKVTELHGRELVDDYFWLRQRDEAEVIEYLEQENSYTQAMMAHTADLQESLYEEMVGRIQETDLSVPVRVDDYFYYTRTEKGAQYPIYCRKKGSLDAEEEVILDLNVLAEGHEYYRIGGFEVSPNHQLLAFAFDTSGAERYTLKVKDLVSGELLGDAIENVTYGLEWGNDNRTLFYVVPDDANRPYQVRRHVLGQASSDDVTLFEDPDERFFVSVRKTRSRQYLIVSSGSAITSEEHILDADQPLASPTLFAARQQGVEYDLEHQGGHFFVRTNEDARNFRLFRTAVGEIDRASWQEIIPHRPEVELEAVEPFANHLVIVERAEGLRRLEIRPTEGESHFVEMPEPVYAVFPSGNSTYDTALLRFQYASLVTPRSVFDYQMDDRSRTLLKQVEVGGGYDPADYASERIFAQASDGTRVPVSLVYRRGALEGGPAPTWLSGYGSYGVSIDPFFSSSRLSLLDRGMVYAIAHVRGGGEMGETWHDDGKLLAKRNTFTDFISVAEHLIAEGYTSPDHLAISGGSAGGLLMGAVLNMRPDLFTAAHAAVPFVDVINTMLDTSIPLTVTEFEEWGNPQDPKYFEYMLSYSPYDNVEERDYPHLLVTAGLNDPRVQYWEPAKWTAKLRAHKTDDNRLLLKTNMGAGHGGSSGRYSRLKETAFEYAFVLDALGLAAAASGGP